MLLVGETFRVRVALSQAPRYGVLRWLRYATSGYFSVGSTATVLKSDTFRDAIEVSVGKVPRRLTVSSSTPFRRCVANR